MRFNDLQEQYKVLKDKMDEAIINAVGTADYIMGEEVRQLETELADYVGKKYCITCANGTDALSLALMAYGIKAGDAIFVPTFTFFSSAEVIKLAGATPVFVDIDPETFNISPQNLKKAINKVLEVGNIRPRAVIAVDLFGLPADFDSLRDISAEYNLLLIEDGAQGFGGSSTNRMACSFGDIATTSFFPAKPLGCYGDGGAVFTDEEQIKDILISLRVHGKGSDKYDNIRIGLNSRLDTIQAAVLLVKLRAFRDYELEKRQWAATMYSSLLGNTVQTPRIPEGAISSYAQYSILFKSECERDSALEKLKDNDIPSMIYYRKSMHEQTVFRNNVSSYWKFPCAEYVSKRILSLPMHPYLRSKDIEIVCSIIKECVEKV